MACTGRLIFQNVRFFLVYNLHKGHFIVDFLLYWGSCPWTQWVIIAVTMVNLINRLQSGPAAIIRVNWIRSRGLCRRGRRWGRRGCAIEWHTIADTIFHSVSFAESSRSWCITVCGRCRRVRPRNHKVYLRLQGWNYFLDEYRLLVTS